MKEEDSTQRGGGSGKKKGEITERRENPGAWMRQLCVLPAGSLFSTLLIDIKHSSQPTVVS